MSAEEAFKLTSDIARSDITQVMDVSSMGFSLDMKKAQELGLGRLIKKVKQKTTTYLAKKQSEEDREETVLEIELYDAQAAQRDIMRMRGKFPGDSQRENASPNVITAPPAALLELVQLIERDKRGAVDRATAVDGTTMRSETQVPE